MSTCPSCSAPVAVLDRQCTACGKDLSDSPTGTAPRRIEPVSPPPSPARERTPGEGPGRGRGERFVPGTVLAGRYRIVGLLGRGGMGEVYRADDLRLDQPVALKFLPHGTASDEERLARFYREVRLARQVSHPAVCRVYDVSEADGHLFLSMELVDGENLASLMRRIGRLPADKAVDIARQLCAGLAAAHQKGVLHRDLKPANVMLDGQGKVRITDFGLAVLAESPSGEDVRSGTPSYMSPEQLQGREVTVRSDVYGLGLLLYEVFTGRRAFGGRTVAEARRQRDERPIEPSTLAPGLEPAVERAILACLEKEPRRRPSSALVVLGLLTGSDLLEAAIQAGETPSPELVAAAGEREGLRPAAAFVLAAFVLAGLAAAPFLASTFQILPRLPAPKAPAVLEDRARELVRSLGIEASADDAWGLGLDWGYLGWVREKDATPGRWQRALSADTPPVLQFWYRQSPRPIVSLLPGGRVYAGKPAMDVTDMASVTYDASGRLLRFAAIPPQLEDDKAEKAASAPDWSRLFTEARLDPQALRAVTPRWTPLFHSDTRAAWEGTWPERKDVAIRVEAAAYRGRPVWFEVITPWAYAERMPGMTWPIRKVAVQMLFFSITLVLMGASGFMARRNLVLGRGDRRGAFRVALVLFAIGVLSWASGAHHVADLNAQMGIAGRGAGLVLLEATFVWLFYLAVEPYARRLRPWTLVSWTRLLGGGLSDPVVGRDTLVGFTWAVCLFLLAPVVRHLPVWLGQPGPEPEMGALEALQGPGFLASAVLDRASGAILWAMTVLLVFVLLKLVLRRDSLATAGVAALLCVHALSAWDAAWAVAAVNVLTAVSWIAVLLRFGLLAGIAGFFAIDLLQELPLTADLSSWTSGPTVLVVALLAALALACARTAAGGGAALRRALVSETGSQP